MDLEKLDKFIKFMDENNLTELEIEEEGKRVKLKKGGAELLPPLNQLPKASPEAESPAERKTSEIEIQSPMVGTFYRAPSPGAKPYVEIGEVIKPGDVVCIIEAMKLMNEIKAEVGGKVVGVPVENGEPVEFGQSLLVVEPA